ncbi:alpha/beta hydrolase [Saccharopolyspora taberi]|uniref:Alpha/beta fold hydrolase n=1 Tax=Saccharopolyspora taberi TaxID=60895 RepID=A0ABN3VL52_9PSEU
MTENRRRRGAIIGGWVVALVVAVGSVTACQTGGPQMTLPQSLTSQKPAWQPCAAPTPMQGGGEPPGGEWQCATIKVPRDYSEPASETIDLALIRKTATDPNNRIGSLMFNFGGPGGSGVSTLPGLKDAYQTLNTRYDLVSFDPRGVGESAGVKCLDDRALDAFTTVDSTPDDPAEAKAFQEANDQYVAACKQNSGAMLPHVDTVSTARDMDLMRQVLGDQKLHYFGISYGTELGGVYAHLFPANVGRAVFDAVVDPTADDKRNALSQAEGFQLALENYLAECRASGECPLPGRKEVDDLLGQLEANPLPTQDGRPLTRDRAVTGIASALYSKESWQWLTMALAEAKGGTGTVLGLLADSYLGRDEQGRYDNNQAANRAINCVDSKQRYTDADVRAALPEFEQASPVFGDFVAWGLAGCTGWPVDGKAERPAVSAPGSAPIVVVGNTGDPATPFEGARRMAAELGTGVNVTLQGEGHGGYNTGNPCLKSAIDGYLLDGKVPADGTTCT